MGMATWNGGRGGSGGAPDRTPRACCRPSSHSCRPAARSPFPAPCGRRSALLDRLERRGAGGGRGRKAPCRRSCSDPHAPANATRQICRIGIDAVGQHERWSMTYRGPSHSHNPVWGYMLGCAFKLIRLHTSSHAAQTYNLGRWWGGRSPDVPADPPCDAEKRVEKDYESDATRDHVVPRRLGSEGQRVDQRQWDHDTPGHEAPHLYDGLLARSVTRSLPGTRVRNI
jgi:hypothetical protein